MPHAWLLTGRAGIGKATLAYRFARFVMAHPDPLDAAVRQAADLAVAPDHPAARLVGVNAHPDLAIVRRTLNTNTKKLASETRVEDIRRATHLFETTASAGGWRVVIVDPADEMNRNAANALLKTLEEPPPRALFLLLSHAPGGLLPTIRSRCRMLQMPPLGREDIRALLTTLAPAGASEAERDIAAEGADGSIHDGLAQLDPGALAVDRKVRDVVEKLPALDQRALHDLLILADGRSGGAAFDAIRRAAETYMLNSIRAAAPHGPGRLAPFAEVWEKLAASAAEAEAYNLDRRPVVLALFRGLADAVSAGRAA